MAAAAKAPHGHAHTLGIAWPLVWLEEYELARQVTDRAIAVQREAGFLLYLPQSLLPRAELDFRTGNWDAALAEASEALALFEETGQPAEAAAASAVLARMEAARGNADECRAHWHSAPSRATSSSACGAPAAGAGCPRPSGARLPPSSRGDRAARDR